MRAFILTPFSLALFFLIGIATVSHVRAETLLSVRFTDRNVSFSGMIDSEETGQRLAKAVRSVRPDLAIINAGLKITPNFEMLNVDDLESALSELGISTHGGRIEIHEEYILIGGDTDSLVTITAMRFRIQSLMEGRRFINRICIVPSADLPEMKVSLSSADGEAMLLDFEYHPSATEVFEAPGLPLDKWFPTLVMLSDFDRLEGIKKEPLVAKPLIAMPLGGNAETLDADQVFEALEAQAMVPQATYQTVGSISFSRNAFLLQANQEPAITAVSEALASANFKGLDIILKPIKASGGSGAYNEYLCEKRADEVKRILSETGVMLTNVTTEIQTSSSSVDAGEVQIVVKIPPPPPNPKKMMKESEDDVKVMAGSTATSRQSSSAGPSKIGNTEGAIPEHPLKRFQLKATEAPE